MKRLSYEGKRTYHDPKHAHFGSKMQTGVPFVFEIRVSQERGVIADDALDEGEVV